VSKINGEKFFIICLLVLCISYFLGSLAFGPNARLLPLPVSLVSIALCILAIASRRESQVDKKESIHRELKGILLILFFVVLIAFIGPAVGSGVFCMIYMLRRQNLNIIKSLAISICVALFIYYIFYHFLQLTPDSNFQLLY